MMLIDVTYELVTEESASEGDAEERGYVMQSEPRTFREVVQMLKGGEPSSWPANGDPYEWVTHTNWNQGSRSHIEDGIDESRSVHFSHENPARKARYWALAFRAAGLCGRKG